MAMNIKSQAVERLAEEVARMTGETKTEAVRRALEERRARLVLRLPADSREIRLRRFLETEAWPMIPEDQRGRTLTRSEEDAILGYGDHGV